MNPNQKLLDDQVRRQINLERVSKATARKIDKLLDQVRRDLAAKIAAMRSGGASELTVKQQERLLKSARRLQREVSEQVLGVIREDIKATTKDQAEWVAGSLDGATASSTIVKQISLNRAIAAVEGKYLRGKHVEEWLSDMPKAQLKRLEQALRISLTENESIGATVSRIRDVTNMSKRGARTFVRTVNTHIASAVNEATYQENSDLVSRYEWRAVLDNRTTKVCISRDGKIYEVGKGPMPPAHPGCRSTTFAILEDYDPPPRETYEEWLQRQGTEAQNEILGPARGRLFRSGRYPVSSFVDVRGKTLTLDELKPKKKASKPAKPKEPALPKNLKSMGQAKAASDAQVDEWHAKYAKKSREVDWGGGKVAYEIELPDVDGKPVRLEILGTKARKSSKIEAAVARVNMSLGGRYRDAAGGDKASGTRLFANAVTALRGHLRSPDAHDVLVFEGASGAHNRLYYSILRRVSGGDYVAYALPNKSKFILVRKSKLKAIRAVYPQIGLYEKI